MGLSYLVYLLSRAGRIAENLFAVPIIEKRRDGGSSWNALRDLTACLTEFEAVGFKENREVYVLKISEFVRSVKR